MSLLNLFTKSTVTKTPTAKQDYVAYAQGAKSEYDSSYTDYVESVEALDKAIKIQEEHERINGYSHDPTAIISGEILKQDEGFNLYPPEENKEGSI